MSLKRATYTDPEGRLKVVLLPEEEEESKAEMGIPLGPPSFYELDLPKEIEIRLNNELFHRGIITEADARLKRQEVTAALLSTIRVDTDRIVNLYVGKE